MVYIDLFLPPHSLVVFPCLFSRAASRERLKYDTLTITMFNKDRAGGHLKKGNSGVSFTLLTLLMLLASQDT